MKASNNTTTASGGIHASRYATDRRELISLINSMRACGVATELDLPRVAIIGELVSLITRGYCSSLTLLFIGVIRR
jgi:hypothetical protein